MTCIVGLVAEDGAVYIGGDSAGIGGWSLTVRKDTKVFRNGPFLIGGSESFRMLQLLHHAFTPPEYDPAIDVTKFMSTTVVDAFRDCFKAGGYARKNSEQEAGGTFLIGFAGRLFYIGQDYQVGEPISGYEAIGCGDQVACGALYATQGREPQKRIEIALQAAEAHNAGVRGPFVIGCLKAEIARSSGNKKKKDTTHV